MSEAFKCGYIALIGYPNVGKSTLLNRLVGVKLAITSPKPQTTRFRLLGIVNLPEAQLLFLDTPGVIDPKGALNESLVQAALTALAEADVVVWLTEPRARFRQAVEHLRRLEAQGKLPLDKKALLTTVEKELNALPR